jgi:catechol 2,3-dioxygenase-like lactoylglutathione lyase family enzyme
VFRHGVVTLMVDDLARSIGFYRDTLHLRPVGDAPDAPEFEGAGIRLRLHRRRPEIDRAGSGTAAIGLEVDDVEAGARTLSDRGVRMGRILPSGRRRIVLFDDPDGNHWYLFDTTPAGRDRPPGLKA